MINKNKKYTPIRFSHLMTYAGIGAITRGVEDKLMVIIDTRYWKNGSTEIEFVERASSYLGIDKNIKLKRPPIAQIENKKITGATLPAVLFPKYAVCSECGLLHKAPWGDSNDSFDELRYCTECKKKLEQVTWCAVSTEGYLDDVPWHYICHKDSKTKKNCKEDYSKPNLKIVENKIVCTKCKSSNDFKHFIGDADIKKQPWLNERENTEIQIMEVNDPRVYFPKTQNVLIIPPESRRYIDPNNLRDVLRHYEFTKFKYIATYPNNRMSERYCKELAKNNKVTPKKILEAITNQNKVDNIELNSLTPDKLTTDEYKAFLEPLPYLQPNEDFVTDHKTDEWNKLKELDLSPEIYPIIDMISNHVIAKKLREIQVFNGFQRVNYINNEAEDNSSETKSDKQETQFISPNIDGKCKWLPAIELYGEGIFISLKEELLKKWEELPGVKERFKVIDKRYKKSDFNSFNKFSLSPRFILLHTLAHLIIRQLEISAGYPAASLKERIYSSTNKDDMAGILIYIAVPDTVGSLGGIIESAQPKKLLALLANVFKHAQWCSLDPVCSQHKGQGANWLNRAACHACALVPETSCQFKNAFLDRVFIKGDEKEKIPNFLDFIKDFNNEKKKI